MIRLAAATLALGLSACAAAPPPVARPAAPTGPAAFRAEVRAGQAPDCPLVGTAVHVGGGRFLTAAHIVDGIAARMRDCRGRPLEPRIALGGRQAPARLVRVGDGELTPGIGLRYRRGEDLALLEAPALSGAPTARPCGAGPDPGQRVVVASRLRVLTAAAGRLVPEGAPAFGAYADLPMAMVQGESGAGVFDAESLCLLGLVSHRPDEAPERTRIVPAAAIRAFLGG